MIFVVTSLGDVIMRPLQRTVPEPPGRPVVNNTTDQGIYKS